MIFKRKIYDKLLDWKKSNGTEAVMIEGARRIGKSTIATEFAKYEYKSYILIDFANVHESIKDCFQTMLNDLESFFMIISSEYKTRLYRRESVIIFDEVQKFPRAREAIKYLVADGRYDYIETGSLISIRENVEDIVIPSEERNFKMYPLDFEEFCWAFGEEPLIEYIKDCFKNKKPLVPSQHKKAMLLFRQFMLVGGMPQSIVAFLENDRDFYAADKRKRGILSLYREDIMKIRKPYRAKVIAVFDQIPGLLSKHEKRVKINNIDEGSRAIQYEDTFFWLADSMICNECFSCDDPNIGFSLTENRSYVKCYMGDTGLLVSHAFDENELSDGELYREILLDKLSINEGMLYENAIAQMLTSNGHKLYFYTHYSEEKHRNDIEIDFLLSNNSKLKYKMYPIEVKSSKRYTVTSLERFREKFGSRIGDSYVIHPKNLIVRDDGIICLPAYMTFCL